MGDREHEHLRALDSLAASGLTYVGRKADVRRAETYHVANPSLFASALEEMRRKQILHVGNRTHLELRALDALVASGLTYVGWQADVTEAEKRHVQGVHAFPTNFDSFLDGMQKSQKMHGGDRAQVPCQEVGGTGGPAANVSHKRNAVVDLTGDEEEEEEMGLRKKRQRVNNGGKATADPDEDSECAVCMLAKKQFVCVPCGHVCLCAACADIIAKSSRECPICRVLSTQIIKTFY